jgi:hypothetical protein
MLQLLEICHEFCNGNLRYVTVIGDFPWILQWQFGVCYNRTALFFCQPEVLDLGICWMCNSDYVVKGGKSVTTGSVRLSNKQRVGIFASNSNIFCNAGSMRMFMLFVLCILKCRRHENIYVVCSIYSQMPGAWECLCCVFRVFSNAQGMKMFVLFVPCILKCLGHEIVYVLRSMYSHMPAAWKHLCCLFCVFSNADGMRMFVISCIFCNVVYFSYHIMDHMEAFLLLGLFVLNPWNLLKLILALRMGTKHSKSLCWSHVSFS